MDMSDSDDDPSVTHKGGGEEGLDCHWQLPQPIEVKSLQTARRFSWIPEDPSLAAADGSLGPSPDPAQWGPRYPSTHELE